MYSIHKYFLDHSSNSEKIIGNVIGILHIGQEEVVCHGNPYLCHNSILAGSKKGFNLQVLLDPFEEKLYLPSLLIDVSNDSCRQIEVIGKKLILLLFFFIPKSHSSEIMSESLHSWVLS